MAYNEKLEDWIDHQFIENNELTKKKQMGGVGWLINGNMCCGIYEDLLVVRIDPKNMQTLTQKSGIRQFGTGRENAADFLSISEELYTLPKLRLKFLSHAIAYTASLPPKNVQDQNMPE